MNILAAYDFKWWVPLKPFCIFELDPEDIKTCFQLSQEIPVLKWLSKIAPFKRYDLQYYLLSDHCSIQSLIFIWYVQRNPAPLMTVINSLERKTFVVKREVIVTILLRLHKAKQVDLVERERWVLIKISWPQIPQMIVILMPLKMNINYLVIHFVLLAFNVTVFINVPPKRRKDKNFMKYSSFTPA